MRKQPKTNVDFFADFMNYGSAMNQMFVLDAVTKMAQKIVDNEEQVLKDMEGSFVHGPAWVKCAKDFLKASDEFYNRDRSLDSQEDEDDEDTL